MNSVLSLIGLEMGQIESNGVERTNNQKFNILTMMHAAKDGNIDKVTKCLKFIGSDVNAANRRGNTALHIAAIHGQLDIVRTLLQNGASVNPQCKHGYTPLYYAAMENFPNIVECLLQAGADKNVSPVPEMTPLRVAEMQGHEEVVRLLRDQPEEGAGPG